MTPDASSGKVPPSDGFAVEDPWNASDSNTLTDGAKASDTRYLRNTVAFPRPFVAKDA
jgi:hypothetical protein